MNTMQISRNGMSYQVIPDKNLSFWNDVANGIWEPETFAIFRRFIQADGSYIDIGSWIGPTLLYGCQLAKRAYGIEPDPIAYKELAANVALNASLAPNIRLFNGCIATNTGTVKLGSRTEGGGDSMSSLLFSHCQIAWNVPALTFDDFIRQNEVTNCSFIKMDIEGGEYRVLPTMLIFLRKYRPTLYLSLHPKYLIHIEGTGTFAKVCRGLISFLTTIRILTRLRFYKRFYDVHGNRLTLFRLLWISRSCTALVATDSNWPL